MVKFDKVIKCFEILNFPPDIENFEDKIKVQKVIFLLKIKDVDFGYKFNLYLRGPYSPDLAKDMYKNSDNLKKLKSESKGLEDEIVHQIKYLKFIISLETSSLEIAATYAYLTEIDGIESDKAIVRVKKMKQFISENKIMKGIYKTIEYLTN